MHIIELLTPAYEAAWLPWAVQYFFLVGVATGAALLTSACVFGTGNGAQGGLRQRLLPACVESCVGGARVIGDLYDAHSEINQRINAHKDEIKVHKPGMKTKPHVFYIGLPDEFVNGVDGQATVRLVADHL